MNWFYNNLIIPEQWPPKYQESTLDKPLKVPYLDKKPDTINIKIGRQLFVDDFLIAETDLRRDFKKPVIEDHPIFYPQTALEMNDGYCTCACPFNDGIFYDDEAKKYKMWYQAGWFDAVGYAESNDGIHWKRLSEINPDRKSDRVLQYVPGRMRDGAAVWIDYYAENPDERYKMLVFFREYDFDVKYYHRKPKNVQPTEKAILYKSVDGINWVEVGTPGSCGDNTTFFYNPFTRKWVFSIRTFSKLDSRIRVRSYYETDDFFHGSQWKPEDVRFWARTDIKDTPDPNLGYLPQLYNLDATPYESLMLGVFSVFMGPPNGVCAITKHPKIIDLKLAFSRDGFHWDRPTHENFISSSRNLGTWNYGYMHAANGICVVIGDEIHFYFSCFSGQSPNFGSHKYSGGNLGMARLRRDGFASMSDDGKGGYLTTEVLEYNGKYLFVNADCSQGKILAEILDQNGNVLPGYSREDCIPVTTDSTKVQVKWKNKTVSELNCRNIRLRFILKNAELYSFWFSPDAQGHSNGYMAAGGPSFHKGMDIACE